MQNGKVIDGYVSGATVWLDINGNHRKDADEPSTLSKAAGAYQLELNEAQRACLPYATLYVDVPVGAVDEDSGPVKEAYQMAVPPQLQTLSVDQVLHISPLTTAIWDQVRSRLSDASGQMNSCEQLKADQRLRENMVYEIKTVMGELVLRHNLSEARIYADFIQAKDSQSYQVAQDIVKGLKAGYAHKQTLHALYPDASFVRSEVYRGRGTGPTDLPGTWYRSSSVWRPSGYTHERVILADDLSKTARVLMLRSQDEQAWGKAKLKTTRTAYNWGEAERPYLCVLDEAVEQEKDGASFELVVHYDDPKTETDPLACMGATHAQPGSTTSREYYVNYRVGMVSYTSNLRFEPQHAEHQWLKDWHHLQGKSGQLDFSPVLERIAASGYRFEEPVKIDTYSWYKRSTDDSQLRVILEKDSANNWVKTRTQTDGTTIKECSKDGVNWGNCSP
ncbi:hypothetical protein DBR47_21925 [Paucibacter sp. KBW04]|nr:hypothetical protein DBR47_21925 [Paucibacter sp. KBW04]